MMVGPLLNEQIVKRPLSEGQCSQQGVASQLATKHSSAVGTDWKRKRAILEGKSMGY